jgi:hypothetical protein
MKMVQIQRGMSANKPMFIVFGSMGGSGWELIASLFASHLRRASPKAND